jgi:hypothetical protein
MPYLMFDIIDAPAGPEGADAEVEGDGETYDLSADAKNTTETKRPHTVEEKILRRSMDEMIMVREHVFRTRL